jgi:serine protease Do
MSDSFESLARHVSPAVVEVLVTGFGSDEDSDKNSSGAVGRERCLGSGVIVDSSGYIVTNHHVVEGAERVRVMLNATVGNESQPFALLKPKGRVLNARIVGVDKSIDLAALKVEGADLPTLPLGRYDRLHQGQIVLAFGNPEGLQNSVSLGLVSSVLRQPELDNPMVYIQRTRPSIRETVEDRLLMSRATWWELTPSSTQSLAAMRVSGSRFRAASCVTPTSRFENLGE